MSGYLTNAMILVKTEQWLHDLEAALDRKRTALQAEGRSLSEIENKLLALARAAQPYLRPDPANAADLAPARIENQVGDGISKWAFVGSLGTDFPAASYILALNQRWVNRTLRLGSPRRAWIEAGSTSFALNLLDAANAAGVAPGRKRAVMAYALGHLANVASNVILQPFVNQWVWGDGASRERLEFEQALDARVAYGFFQRSDLHDGPSWEGYYLDKGDYEHDLEQLMDLYRSAFERTYGLAPRESLCNAPADRCRMPTLDRSFLLDGYRNTTNWAIDLGYDQSPVWWRLLWSLALFGGGVLSTFLIWRQTEDFDTILRLQDEQSTAIRNENRTKWQDGGFWANERMWFDTLDLANTASSVPFMLFSWLSSGIFGWDGIFGQGTLGFGDRPASAKAIKIAKPIEFLANIGLNEGLPGIWQQPYVRWPKLIVDLAVEIYTAYGINPGSPREGLEGYKLDRALWYPKLLTFATYFLANLLAFSIKSARHNPDGTRETGASGWDFLVSAVICGVAIGGLVGSGIWEKLIVESVTGARWPSADTGLVNPYLPVVRDGGGRRSFQSNNATGSAVRVFSDANQGVVTDSASGKQYFAQDATPDAPSPEWERRDDQERRTKSSASTKTDYKLNTLIDRATRLSGLLSMAAVNYDSVSASLKSNVRTIFADWNLNYRTVQEWDNLMLEPAAADPGGLLEAVETWWQDLSHDRPTAHPVLERIESRLGMTGLSAQLRGDFTRNGAGVDSEEARGLRVRPPGAILLANLDMDTPITTPLVTPLPDRSTQLDAVVDDIINGSDDLVEQAALKVRKARGALAAHDLVLRVAAADARRIRVFEVDSARSPDAWPRRLGATTVGAPTAEYVIGGGPPDTVEFRIEAVTLTGDPALPAPSGAAPLSPAPDSPAGATVGAPVAPNRIPSEVWVELVHREHGAEVADLRDVGVFTIAPFLLQPNTHSTIRVYVTYFEDVPGPPLNLGNHSMVADLIEGLEAALGSARVKYRTRPAAGGGVQFVTHQPLPPGDPDAPDGLYIIKGEFYPDQWVQDEFEIGYCHAPHGWMHVTLHCARQRGLDTFVHSELPGKDMGLFNQLRRAGDSLNYGGNLEVSPPVAHPTAALPADAAGPAIPAQPVARFGKIILGEARLPVFDMDVARAADLDAGIFSLALESQFRIHGFTFDAISLVVAAVTAGSEWRVADDFREFQVLASGGRLQVYFVRLADQNFRRFLEAQIVQPVLTLDTAWLNVGHVDEFMSFVPATTGGKDFRMLMASSQLAVDLLEAAQALHFGDSVAHPLTALHRGQRGGDGRPGSARISVDDALLRLRNFNVDLQVMKLTPLEERLKAAIELTAADVVRIPVLFAALPPALLPRLGTIVDIGGRDFPVRTTAFTPDMVNLTVVDRHLMVPKPFGPRMHRADVVSILTGAGLATATEPRLAPLEGHWHWAPRNTTVASIAALFGVPTASIRSHGNNAGKFVSDRVRDNWARVWIPEANVDLFEAYVTIALEDLGLTVHFIDDWDFYHSLEGEVHCGTNVLRTPPETVAGYSGPHWWGA